MCIRDRNTICNDDPDIIPLLNTPAPCAFERDENGVFQQIKDWKPDEDEEDPDMDILQQCQKWHEEDKHQKIVDALEAISAEERTPVSYTHRCPANNTATARPASRWRSAGKSLSAMSWAWWATRIWTRHWAMMTCLLYTSRCV